MRLLLTHSTRLTPAIPIELSTALNVHVPRNVGNHFCSIWTRMHSVGGRSGPNIQSRTLIHIIQAEAQVLVPQFRGRGASRSQKDRVLGQAAMSCPPYGCPPHACQRHARLSNSKSRGDISTQNELEQAAAGIVILLLIMAVCDQGLR